MGVVQGSVLAALLFIVFFNPLVEAIRPISPIIGGLRIAPQLFADDGTLIALSWAVRERMIKIVLRWASRWNTILSLSKSKSLTALIDPNKTQADLQSILQEVESATILGLEFVRRGARPLTYIKNILQRSAACTRRLLSLTLEGQLRLDTITFIYKSKALSLYSHSLPFAPPDSYALTSLQTAHDDFARGVLSLPENTPGYLAAAEVGLLDLDLAHAKAAILLHHRIANNLSDTLTPTMLDWPLAPHGLSSTSQCQNLLTLIGSTLTVKLMICSPYLRIKHSINILIHKAQFARYKANILSGKPSLHPILNYKRSTDIDRAISRAPAKKARRYIMVRLQVLTMSPGLTCPLCPVTYAPIQHALWQCPAQTITRESLITNVAQRSEHAAAYMRTLDVAELTHFITGGGATTYGPSLWHDLQTLFIQYIWDVTEKLSIHQQTHQS
jgi:hypothetical protein